MSLSPIGSINSVRLPSSSTIQPTGNGHSTNTPSSSTAGNSALPVSLLNTLLAHQREQLLTQQTPLASRPQNQQRPSLNNPHIPANRLPAQLRASLQNMASTETISPTVDSRAMNQVVNWVKQELASNTRVLITADSVVAALIPSQEQLALQSSPNHGDHELGVAKAQALALLLCMRIEQQAEEIVRRKKRRFLTYVAVTLWLVLLAIVYFLF